MKTILLTGPTGSVGYETLKELLKQKDTYRINVFELKTKKTESKLKPFKKHINIFWGSITDKEAVNSAVKDSDIIIHTAALIPPAADEFTELAEKINVQGTQNVVDALNLNNPEAFVIYTSSISVYGDRIDNPEIKLLDPLAPSPKDHYATTKIKAENYIKINAKNFTIFRLSAVMNPIMKLDPLFFHMPLNTKLEIVTAKDVAFALVKAIEKKEYLNERIFNLGGGMLCRISYNDFLKENFRLFGLKNLDFPKYAFAEKNFHCGYYKDTDSLNKILQFQRDSIDDYLKEVAKVINPFKKGIVKMLRPIIKNSLLKRSDPYKAHLNRNIELIKHFFIHKSYTYSN